MELFEFLNPPSLVEQKKKYATFTVKEIGGPEELLKWRAMQEAKESVYRMRLGEQDKRMADFESSIGQKVASPTLSTSSWAEKQAFVDSERDRLAKANAAVQALFPASLPEPKKPFLQKAWGVFAAIWKTANF